MRSYSLMRALFLRPWHSFIILTAFLFNSLGVLPLAQAQEFILPKPGQMVTLSPAYSPVVLKGIKLDPKNPFRFHFYVDTGDGYKKGLLSPNVSVGDPQQEQLKIESTKLIKYFLAALTIPEKDLWVTY